MNNTSKSKKPSIVCIGGGTGTFVALKGLKHSEYSLRAIVTMSDSGGSNKRIRDEFGLLPTSDIRQCLVALSDENGGAGLLRKLFMYRFEKGTGISGMTFGNLFMAALADILGSQKEAIRQTGKVLRIQGEVIPVSFTDTNLIATYENGQTIDEEHLIDEPEHDGTVKITNVTLHPKAEPNTDALEAIREASCIVLGPGDLYTSLIPNLLVDGIAKTIRTSKAKKLYVLNLMTKYGQTYGYSATNHIEQIEKYIGTSLDAVIVNTLPFSEQAIQLYRESHEEPVVDDIPKKAYYTVIRAPVAAKQMSVKSKSDVLIRSLIRHDSEALAETILRYLRSKK